MLNSVGTTSQHRLKLAVWFLLSAGIAFWFLYSYMLLVDGSNFLLLLYSLYLATACIVLIGSRRDVLAPMGIFTLISFVGLGVGVPYALDSNLLSQSGRSFGVEALESLVVILLAAYVGFAVGTIVWKVTGRAANDRRSRALRVGPAVFVGTFVLVVVSGWIRIRFHLGEVGIQPTIPYAGYAQYLLFNGVLLLCLWFFSQALKQSALYTILGIFLLMLVAATQALLGWRGGIVQVLVLVLVVVWYRIPGGSFGTGVFFWPLLVIVTIPTLMQVGNAVRADKVGGDVAFAESGEEFIEKLARRSQGTSRLAEVAQHVGPITWTNSFFYLDLERRSVTTTEYIDRVVYGISSNASNSVGTSGPGGPYLAAGLVGVLVCYALLGILYRWAYNVVRMDGESNALSVAWYACLVHALLGAVSENFNFATIKLIGATTIFYLALRLLFLIKARTSQGL